MPVSMQTKLSLPSLPKLARAERSVPRSQKERLWLIAGGLIAFVMFLIGYFFFISPQRSSTNSVNAQVAQVNSQNAALQARIDSLAEQNKNLAKYEADLAQARLALPTTSGISDFLRTLQALGSATLTNVTQLSVGQPTDLSGLAGGAPTAAASATTAPDANSTPTAAPTATASAPSAASIYALSINATVTGSPTGLEKFLDQLQTVQPRAVLITNIVESSGQPGASQPGQHAAATSLQIIMEAFVAPPVTAVNSALSPSPAPASTSATP